MTDYLITDIHSHILFGIDDGAESLEMSLEMLKEAERQGVRNIFCTSHHWSSGVDVYDKNFNLLKRRLKEEHISINLFKGMEILCSGKYLSEVVSDIKNGTAKTLNGTDYVLLEMFPYMSGEEIFECVNSFIEQTCKKVIIAHVERYEGLYNDDLSLMSLKELGCLFQINAYSLAGEQNIEIKSFARRLLAERLVDFIGSDAHRINHRPPKLRSGVEYIYNNCDKDYADGVCFKNAESLIKNEVIY